MRRFTARSLVLSVLLGSHPPRLPVTAIIDFCSLFAIAPGTVRTAISRMVTGGELVPDAGGYQVAGALLERQRQQDVGRVPPDPDWDGSWWTAIALADVRSVRERRRFRSVMEGAKMGELRPAVWVRPANISGPPPGAGLLVGRGDLETETASNLVERLWDLDGLDRRAALLVEAITSQQATLAERFVTLAACLQFLRTEPQLPPDLAPTERADALRARYGVAEAAFQAELRDFLQTGGAAAPSGAAQ